MRRCISIRGLVRPLIHPSARPSVCLSIRPSIRPSPIIFRRILGASCTVYSAFFAKNDVCRKRFCACCWINLTWIFIVSHYKIWFHGRKIKTVTCSTGCLSWRGSPFVCLLSPLTHYFALHCSLGSRALLRSFLCFLTHSLPSLLENEW